jgi:hypothetical protein
LNDVQPDTSYYITVTGVGAANQRETWYRSESWDSDEITASVPSNRPPDFDILRTYATAELRELTR